jgi:CheY-like chemotaxis protein
MADSLRILILEDNPVDAELIQFELREAGVAFSAKVVTFEGDFIAALQEFQPDLILSDYDLPAYNGALALAEAGRRRPGTPFILVTGALGEDRAIEILTQGAKDYVMKSRLQKRLVPAVKRALAEAEEHRARTRAEQELREAHGVLIQRVALKAVKLQEALAAGRKMAKALRESKRRQALLTEVLAVINEPLSLEDTIHRILAAIRREKRLEAVGIRLQSGNDFPYFVQHGFSDEFVQAENGLTVRAQDGGLCRDDKGNISLECTCGLVLSGRTDPENPLFTPGGSFWTNDTLPLLDLSADQDPRLNPRNRCIHEGYRSVALIPIRAQRDIVGLLQLNDRREGAFTPEMIACFEGLGATIGIALSLKQGGVARPLPTGSSAGMADGPWTSR